MAAETTRNFELGIENDLTKVMINQQISSLGFQLTLNTRNKVLRLQRYNEHAGIEKLEVAKTDTTEFTGTQQNTRGTGLILKQDSFCRVQKLTNQPSVQRSLPQ